MIQYVYENKIGAKKVGIRKDCWKDQTGRLRTSVDFEISKEVTAVVEYNNKS